MHPWIAVTDLAWFDFLAGQSDDRGRLDEVNFWNPSGKPMRRFGPGEPVFLRLKSPRNVIAGYGFFAHFTTLRLDKVWELFGEKNGAGSYPDLLGSIARNRHCDVGEFLSHPPEIGCTILRDAVFWPSSRWILWREAQGWSSGLVRGRTEDDPARVQRLLDEIQKDHQATPPELVRPFVLRDADDRRIVQARAIRREGQGTFRAVLLDAYGRRCSITGERTLPVLDAAHIQPYLGPDSNHVQNGLVLTKEFHTLFDLGYVTVTPEFEIRVSPRLRKEWNNGKRYYAYDNQPLVNVPDDSAAQPSGEALEWHSRKIFLA